MRIFTAPQIITLNSGQIAEARRFARAVIGTVDYRDSNQANLYKIEDDHFVSKLGEEAVRAAFEAAGAAVKPPDYTIYGGKEKSWEDDLTINGVGLAVKTQKKSAALRYGLSWTFQASGVRTDPIVRRPDAWVCFVECNDTLAGFPCRVFPPYQILELTFRPPKLPHLAGKKQVVYAAELPVMLI